MSKIKTVNVTSVREQNLNQILNLIRQKRAVSRANIVRQTGLSATTVSAITSDLLNSGFVTESGVGQSSGGRPPILLTFNYNFRHVLGVDIGATHITAVAMNLNGTVAAHQSYKYDVVNDPDGAIQTLYTMVQQTMIDANLTADQILGMGVTIPAPLTGLNLDRLTTIYMPKWENVDLVDLLRQRFPFPIYIDNDANAGAIAEKWWGKGREHSHLAYIKLGVGVGSGLILNNEIYRGSGGTAGEIGHTTINVNGPPCRCGNQGCMEAYVGINAVIEQVYQRKTAAIPSWQPEKPLTIEDIIHLAKTGDPICRSILRSTGTYLGIAIANLINLFNPKLIILGGDLTAAEELITDAVRLSVEERTMFKAAREATITLSTLGQDAVAIGGATLAIQYAFEPSRLSGIMTGNLKEVMLSSIS
ncbi:MAG: ROK family protein [Chloroflexota bacterium]